jgi:hypothetical protein
VTSQNEAVLSEQNRKKEIEQEELKLDALFQTDFTERLFGARLTDAGYVMYLVGEEPTVLHEAAHTADIRAVPGLYMITTDKGKFDVVVGPNPCTPVTLWDGETATRVHEDLYTTSSDPGAGTITVTFTTPPELPKKGLWRLFPRNS